MKRIKIISLEKVVSGAMKFLSLIRADLARFNEDEAGIRGWVRGVLSQGFWAIFVYRIFSWFYARGVPTQPVRFLIERCIEMATGISIPAEARIGKGIRIHHFGGIFIHSNVSIGENCTIYQGVTLGDRGGRGGVPKVGDRVIIGAGAKLIGPIEIGDDCRIGANAVVTKTVPSGCVAVGVPAVFKKPLPDQILSLKANG